MLFKKKTVKSLLIIFLFSYATLSFGLEQKVQFASQEKAKSLLKCKDVYLKGLSHFDIQSRYNACGNAVCLDEWLDLQSKSWSKEEIERLDSLVLVVHAKIDAKGYDISFPDTIWMVRSTGNEEGGSLAYTRMNYIVFGDMISVVNDSILEHTIAHELFHIFSRNNPDLQEKLYHEIGFYKVKFPSLSGELDSLRITNPDAPDIAWAITLDTCGVNGDFVLFLYASERYSEGPFYRYMRLGFIPVSSDGEICREDIVSFQNVSGFYEKVGSNTNYVMHPEEILAENFAFSLNTNLELPSQDVLLVFNKYLQ